ncbi:GNAT family N-acetyltransferase [Streptomyces chromofuscus]|uniref:GNAT family N-acetyltransferase n=1 Tax=Streptomyces chromofuscus TaxID=42881 RepID=A0A7M2T521_STRCW|nr:GNAT family N-acetyltransferase [Streptomyces chromofuscus]QOV43229.1 GNAT family N-acetyltransferase [Streptomyces chromofuscus]GGT32434.1 aminoglycoside N-acetyltransferase AAC(2')-Ie [Streptomyces chromofuscus]
MTATAPRTVHTADLAPADLLVVRGFLDDSFDGDFGDADWDHTLGGLHVLVHDERGLAAHGAVVMRRVRHGRRWLRTGYVEGVAVRRDVRRTGLGGRVMAALEGIITRAYDLGALSASDDGVRLYEARGWRAWGGRVCALGPDGVVRLPEEEGSTYVWPAPADEADPDGELVFDWRDGDVL